MEGEASGKEDVGWATVETDGAARGEGQEAVCPPTPGPRPSPLGCCRLRR